jgi:hypothetical protein
MDAGDDRQGELGVDGERRHESGQTAADDHDIVGDH